MLWILLARIVHLERMRGRRRGAVSCVNTPRLCALVSLQRSFALPHCTVGPKLCPRRHPGPKFHNKTAGAFVWG
jgi:hypothetical protein